MRIKEVGSSHANEINNIISKYQKDHEYKAQLNWSIESISEILSLNKCIGFIPQYKEIVESDIDILGFIIYRDLTNVAEILLLGTKIENQSQGIMRALISFLKENYSELWLEVHEQNTKAFQFYKKAGFKLDGVRLKYYTDGKAALVMSWKRGLAIC
jgi:ribosomal protein S18 acetylase RimI-like enzyme